MWRFLENAIVCTEYICHEQHVINWNHSFTANLLQLFLLSYLSRIAHHSHHFMVSACSVNKNISIPEYKRLEIPHALTNIHPFVTLLWKGRSSPLQRKPAEARAAVSEAGGVFVPSASAALRAATGVFRDRESPFRPSVRQQQPVRCCPVLLWNQVVEDGIDGCAQVEKLQGEYIEVLGEQHHPGVLGVYKNDPADVERQPANYKGQNHHSCKTKLHRR